MSMALDSVPSTTTNVETTQMPTNRQMNEENTFYLVVG